MVVGASREIAKGIKLTGSERRFDENTTMKDSGNVATLVFLGTFSPRLAYRGNSTDRYR